jgi:penicillin-binding protein 1C
MRRSMFCNSSKWQWVLLGFLVLGCIVIYKVYQKVPDFISVVQNHKASDTLVLDRNGFPLLRMRTSLRERSLDWMKIDEAAPIFINLLIATEDQRFYHHSGVDPIALGHALFENLKKSSTRGASTISMQVTKLLALKTQKNRAESKSPLAGLKSPLAKIQQIFNAVLLEFKWNKQEILESYLNLISLRGEILGLKTASYFFFNKAPDSLNAEESAILIALIRSPNAAPEIVRNRSCRILKKTDHYKNCEGLERKINESLLNPTRLTRDRNLMPVFSKFLIDQEKTGSIVTSIDLRIQNVVLSALREQLIELKARNVRDGAVLVLDTQTGKTLAYAGNAGPPITEQYHIDGIQSRRQLGSTLKPFIYATAFDLNILDLNSLVEDSKTDIPTDTGQVYHPQNYDHSFRGLVSAAEALASSLNVPAVRTLLLVRPRQVLMRMKQLGFTQLNDDDYYGPSLALGTVDASLWQLTQAYRNIVATNVFNPNTQRKIFEALSFPEYRRFTFGLDSTLSLPFPTAVKTGTSKDMRDNWCVGWNEKFVVGVWVGNFNGEPMWNVSGLTGAAPIWRKIMLALNPHDTSQAEQANPNSLPTTGYIPPQEPLPKKTLSRIRYPVDHMILAIDPNIPKAMQKMILEIENPLEDQKIFLNDSFIQTAKENIFLPLNRGHFRLVLKNKKDVILDEVPFEVR